MMGVAFRVILASVVCDVALGAGGKKVAVKETTVDSTIEDIVWLGNDHQTVLMLTKRGRLYKSSNGGDSWTDFTDSLLGPGQGTLFADNLVASPSDKNTALITGSKRHHFITTDRGATWRQIKQKSTVHTFIFHKTRPKWALISTWTEACDQKVSRLKGKDDPGPCSHMLYLTKDMGRTFSLVASYIVQFAWGPQTGHQQDRIYFTHFRNKKGDQERLTLWSKNVDFCYTDDFGQKINRVVYRGNKFLAAKDFIFVAKLKNSDSQTVTLMVSSDGGSNFRPAQLPQELDEKSYTILDASEGTVMLHVNHGTNEGSTHVGTVYVSDAEGVRYTISLPNNVRSANGECEFDKVVSMEGTYMANFLDITRNGDSASGDQAEGTASKGKEEEQLEESATQTQIDKRRKSKGKDESVVRTVISFDKGGVWSYLKPPSVDSMGKKIDCPQDRCWLHLHGLTTFRNYAPFYSIENAIGMIMGTGNVGPHLRYEPDQVNTYISRDGGLTWSECHKGAFIYEFGDHGGLVVMANDIRKTKQVVFSWNEGQSWYDFEVTEFPLEVDNIVTEPNSTSTKFLMYGSRGDAGVIHHLDFDALGQPLCMGVWGADSVSSDYETWTPSDGRATADGRAGNDRCLLGRQVTYTRRKQTSECFNGEQFERPVTRKNCPCTEQDFECEMGFSRKIGSNDCRVADESLTQAPDKCTSSSFYMAVAHRKVSGDTCEGGYQPSQVAVPCPANSKLSQGAISILGSFSSIGVVMVLIVVASRSERFKSWMANTGFENFNAVKYATIGAQSPETALDSVGQRFDHDFLDNDQDDFVDDAPQLMSLTGGNKDDENRIRGGGLDAASAQVPRLAAPPSGGGFATATGGDDEVDLL
eukprot:TRINITY_DN61841_c0_g1_i1.p1 TRINITY_DN61841_c0_g1~~TRINITY_DN61841_c0_g1_i1.p1  ORF type:complete len:870 (-),score=172.66 TRINITY_DN61841_c0_g1_i1:108-2717(-)